LEAWNAVSEFSPSVTVLLSIDRIATVVTPIALVYSLQLPLPSRSQTNLKMKSFLVMLGAAALVSAQADSTGYFPGEPSCAVSDV
jgi:hypothetical protein